MRESASFMEITNKVINDYLLPILSPDLFKETLKDQNKLEPKHFEDKNGFELHKITNDVEEVEENNKQKELVFKIADTLFLNKSSLMDIIHKNIYDKVIDGKEYQLIRRTNFVDRMINIGINLNLEEQIALSEILPLTLNDYWDINGIKILLENLGIWEDIPKSSKHLDYLKLEPNSIRLFNKIIKYMKENNISDPDEFIGQENIESVQIFSKTKEDKIDVLKSSTLKTILKDKKILNHGDDLDENFIEFLEVSSNYEDTLMMRKFRKALLQIKNSRYFSYFGTCTRNGGENQLNPILNVIPQKNMQKYKSKISMTTKNESDKLLSQFKMNKVKINKESSNPLTSWKLFKLSTIYGRDSPLYIKEEKASLIKNKN